MVKPEDSVFGYGVIPRPKVLRENIEKQASIIAPAPKVITAAGLMLLAIATLLA